jgi:hypothetical protein
MSEPASQPGAPSDGATKIPPPSEKSQSIARDVEKRLPNQVTNALKKQDGVILRLNK